MTTTLAVLLTTVVLGANASPARWAEAIAAFEQQDKTSPPPQDGIVFVGKFFGFACGT